MRLLTRDTLALVLGALAVCAATADAAPKKSRYTPTPVENGGAITGLVHYNGPAQQRKLVAVTTSEDVCHSDPIYSEDLVVSEDGGVRWAVVSIKKIKAGKPFPEPSKPGGGPTMGQEGCVFTPHVVVAPIGETVTLLNNDGVLHNVHTWPKKNRSTNIAMPGSVTKMTTKFRRPERIRVTCDIHPWMVGWFIATDHPYNAVTTKSGAFELTDVPAGTYTLELWHETLGTQKQTVTVEPGKTTEIEFTLDAGSTTK